MKFMSSHLHPSLPSAEQAHLMALPLPTSFHTAEQIERAINIVASGKSVRKAASAAGKSSTGSPTSPHTVKAWWVEYNDRMRAGGVRVSRS